MLKRSALISLLRALVFEICDFAQVKFLSDETQEGAQRTPRHERLLIGIRRAQNMILPLYAVAALLHAFAAVSIALKLEYRIPFVYFTTLSKEGLRCVLTSTIMGVSILLRVQVNPFRSECKVCHLSSHIFSLNGSGVRKFESLD